MCCIMYLPGGQPTTRNLSYNLGTKQAQFRATRSVQFVEKPVYMQVFVCSPAAAKPPRDGRVLKPDAIQGEAIVLQGLHEGHVHLPKLPRQPGVVRL